MGWFRGIPIGIENTNRTGAASTITAYFASDRIVKVSIDSYLGRQYCLKVVPNRLSYEQYLCIAIYRYVLITAIIGLQ